MSKTNQRHVSNELPSNTAVSGSEPPLLLERAGDQISPDQTAPRKATGPRTAQGKNRTRLNPPRHGLLSKFVMIEGESPDEYRSFSIGLIDDFQPQGELEFVLVDYLTVLLWRLRRCIKAESGDISEKRLFMETEMRTKQANEAWQLSKEAMASQGLVAHDNNLSIVKEIHRYLS